MNNIELQNLKNITRIADKHRKIYADLTKTVDMSHVYKQLTQFTDSMQKWQSEMNQFHSGITKALQVRPVVFEALDTFEKIQKNIRRFSEEHTKTLENWHRLANGLNVNSVFSAYIEVGSEFKNVFDSIQKIDSRFERTLSNFSNIGIAQSSVTRLYLSELDIIDKETVKVQADIEPVDKLDNLLLRVHPSLVEKRKGAWLAFRSNNPDRLSQAANSMVELMNHTLRLVLRENDLKTYFLEKNSPSEVKNYEKKVIKWLERTCSWVSLTKDTLHDIKHGFNKKPEEFVESIMVTSEQILIIVLSSEE